MLKNTEVTHRTDALSQFVLFDISPARRMSLPKRVELK